MRNMSFMLTTRQVRDGTKTVTRRLGWAFLKPGDRLMACVKCQGLGKGGKIEKIREIEVVSVYLAPLCEMETYDDFIGGENDRGRTEAAREGFPGLNGHQFVCMFCDHMNCESDVEVNRIEFKYVVAK